MKIINFLSLLQLYICQYVLNIEQIYILNENILQNKNFSIIFNIKHIFPKNLYINNIFEIELESQNSEESNKKIVFECHLFYGKLYQNDTYLKCKLKEKSLLNVKGPFYFRNEHFKKCYMIENKKKTLNISFEMLEEIFYIGMIKIVSNSRNIFGFECNFRFSNIIIPISMSLDDNYVYPTIVSITSLMLNSNSIYKYIFYIMHPSNLSKKNLLILKSLEKKYKNKCSIQLINMHEKYNISILNFINTPAYYRLLLPDLLPNVDKIIWLDGDTLIFNDLKEMYDINIDGYYYKGFLDDNPSLADSFTLENDHCICSGVMLMNLNEIRKNNMTNKTIQFMVKNEEKLSKQRYRDQIVINVMYYHKIGILPAKFGIFNYDNSSLLSSLVNIYRYKYKYSIEELKDAYYNPIILHYVFKPWSKRKEFVNRRELWWEYAKKTEYYNEIFEKLYPKKTKDKKKNKNKKIIQILKYVSLLILFIYILYLCLKKKKIL